MDTLFHRIEAEGEFFQDPCRGSNAHYQYQRPVNAQSAEHGGLNNRTGVEPMRLLKKLKHEFSEDDRDEAQLV